MNIGSIAVIKEIEGGVVYWQFPQSRIFEERLTKRVNLLVWVEMAGAINLEDILFIRRCVLFYQNVMAIYTVWGELFKMQGKVLVLTVLILIKMVLDCINDGRLVVHSELSHLPLSTFINFVSHFIYQNFKLFFIFGPAVDLIAIKIIELQKLCSILNILFIKIGRFHLIKFQFLNFLE